MANKIFNLPIKGFSEGLPVDKENPSTSGYMNNVRPVDVLDKKIRLGQRPGLDKVYTQQIGGVAAPIVLISQITTVD